MSTDYTEFESKMKKTASVLTEQYDSVRAGQANPAVLDRITVDYYGSPTPIQQIASVSTPDARSLLIQPWDASVLKGIEKAILASDLGLNPQNDGRTIRLIFPALTEERRRDLVKQVKKYGEEAKVAVRNIRRDAMDKFKAQKKKSEITEDDLKIIEKDLQKLTDDYIKEVERIPFQDLALVFTAGIIIPWMLSSLVRLGLNDPKAPYLLLPFVITWLSDSGAFFVGRSLGKTKLAPALSPHKTVEGCVGGFVCAIAAAMLYGLVLHLCGYRVQIGLLAIYGFFGSLAGQTGDLAFSAIKREHGVKDYSNLLPGHGGMLDRFDSTIFTAPMLELLVLLAPAIAVVAQ